MIKIVHVLTDTNVGGAGIWLINYLKSYDDSKYDVSVILPEKSELIARINKLDPPVKVKIYEASGIADKSASFDGIMEFIRIFKEVKPQIVHTHASLSARIAARYLKISVVNTRHCLENPKRFPINIVYKAINNLLSDIIIGVSQATCDNLISDGVKKEKVRLVYNGVFPPEKLSDTEKDKIKTLYNIPDDHTVVGIVARLEPVKNHELFLKAMKKVLERHEKLTVIIVGDGSLRDELIQLSKDLGIYERVIFTGYLEDASRVMNIIDINCLTSQAEALSISLIEGMYINKASVSTDSKGPCEVIENEVTGLITENHNPDAFAAAVIRLIEDEALGERIRTYSETRADDKFSVKAMNKALEDIYTELIQKQERKI